MLAARGETPAAFGRRCIPAPPHRAEKRAVGAPAADCVAPPSNIPDIAPHRAQDARWGPRSAVVAPLRRGPHGADCAPWGGSSGRLAALGATLEFHHGLLGEAQVISGTVEGRVTDSSGAVLPGVTITALNTATAATFTVATTSEGLYRVPYVPSGTYDVRADLSGFRTETKQGVAVRVNDSAVVDFTLTVAPVSE